MQESPQEQSTKTIRTHSKKGWAALIFSIFALLFALGGIVFQFYIYQLHANTQATWIQQSQNTQASLQLQIKHLLGKFEIQQQVFDELMNRYQSDGTRKELMLAQEAQHLLTLAQYQVLFDNNIPFAIQLLEDVDKTLQQISDPGITPLRASLTGDLTALKAIPTVDMGNIVSRISSISDQVASLGEVPFQMPVKNEPKIPAHLSWKEKIIATLTSLRQIVAIRRLPTEVKPLASPEQHLFIVESIRLNLTQAQWAVLHQNPQLYQTSLEQAQKQLGQFYFRNPAGAKLVEMIQELQQVNIKPGVPNLGNTSSLLHQYIQQLRQSINTLNPSPTLDEETEPLPLPKETKPKTQSPAQPPPTPSAPLLPAKNVPRALPS